LMAGLTPVFIKEPAARAGHGQGQGRATVAGHGQLAPALPMNSKFQVMTSPGAGR